MPQKTIKKTEFDKLARLGSQAALYPYERTKQILIAENIRTQKLNKQFSFFTKTPQIQPDQIYASDHYKAFKQGEAHIKQKNIFLKNLFDMMNALDEQDDPSLHGARWDSIQQIYDEVCRTNLGEKPIFDVFSSQLLEVLDNPKIHSNTTNLKKAVMCAVFVCVALVLTAAILSTTVSFGVISPILLCAYAAGFLGVALQIMNNINRSCDTANDQRLLPANRVRPTEILNASEDINPNNEIFIGQLIGQPVRFI